MKKLLFFITLILTLGILLTSCVSPDGGDTGGDDNTPPSDGTTPDVDGEWDPTAAVLPAKDGRTGIVVLIHDDGTWSTAVTLDELYHEYGLVGDVALLSSKVWDLSTDTPNTAELAKWSALLDTGRWKIVSHSHSHTWWGTTQLTEDGSYVFTEDEQKMYDEIVGSQAIFRELFPGQRVLTFAYPGFTTEKGYVDNKADAIMGTIYSEEARAMLEEHYISSRAGLGINVRIYNPDGTWSKKYANTAYGDEEVWDYFPAYSMGDSNVQSGKISQVITSAAANKDLVVIYMHKVVDELTGGSNEMTTENMRKVCEYIAEYVETNQLWCTHYEDAVLYAREYLSARIKLEGDETGLTLTLTDKLDDEIYNYPVTVRVRAPKEWEAVKVVQGDRTLYGEVKRVDGKLVVDMDLIPDGGTATIVPIPKSDIPTTEVDAIKPPVSAEP